MKPLDKVANAAFVIALILTFSISARAKTSIVDAGKRAKVADLEKLLSKYGRRANSATGASEATPDASVKARDDQMQAIEIEFIQLTERLTPWTRERLERTYRLGPQGFDALERVADLSALQPPPPDEIATDPTPDAAEQRRIFDLARTAGLDGLTKLPPYSLQSITEYYNNGYVLRSDQNMVSDMINPYKHKWRGVGPWISTFSVEEGIESADRDGAVTEQGRLPRPPNFSNRGEFGAQAALILSDIGRETPEFLRWEKSPSGQFAVFHYSVAAQNSHYRVDASCGKGMAFHSLPAYQGTISIDPRTGGILRLTMEAAAQKKDPIFGVAAVTEYGPVRLGETEANLPLRSLTFMTEDPNVCLGTKGGIELASGGIIMVDYLPMLRYNRVIFTDYRAAEFVETQTFPGDTGEAPAINGASETSDVAEGRFLTAVSNRSLRQTSVAELDRLLDKLNRQRGKELSEYTLATQRRIRSEMIDEEMAESISELELTERLDTPRRERLMQQYQLGSQSSAALELLADLSALREPPPDELAARPAPNEETQQRMLQSARDSSITELEHLPNFFARRETKSFSGELLVKGGIEPINGNRQNGSMKLIGSTTLKITYRDGREIIDDAGGTDGQSPATKSADSGEPNEVALAKLAGGGLNSWGEFGSELVTVLSDMQHGAIHFQHWENGSTGLVAVFRFEVPQNSSHYQVNSDCGRNGPFHAVPAYKGTIGLDAESNRVVRLEVETASQQDDPISGIASIVEYDPVQIGEKSFNRPQRSMTFLTVDPGACVSATTGGRRPDTRTPPPHYLPMRQFNRITFSDYHRLGSTIRILPQTQGIQGSDSR